MNLTRRSIVLVTLTVVVLVAVLPAGIWYLSRSPGPGVLGPETVGATRDAPPAAAGRSRPESPGDAQAPEVTFRQHIAPILHANCVTCHRPNGAGPFSLIEYEDARRRARLIAAVTTSRYMPPWQPAPGRGRFLAERRLDESEIDMLAKWAADGAPEGSTDHPLSTPVFESGWQLGPPDLVVELPEAYSVKAEGVDEFRNLVLPLPVGAPRFVKAIEFRPGNPRVVHHAVMQVDRSRASRLRDEAEPGPGFGGMDLGNAENPGGQFIGWTPGKIPVVDERLAWRLDPGTDLVVQLHMVPSGKVEAVQPQVGLYFTDRPPVLHPVSLVLRNDDIDIPPGDSNHVIEDDVTLPVAVQAVGIYPHAHYIGKEVEVWAELPGGETEWLIHIPAWDFNWQDDYRFLEPVHLPAGTRVRMRYTYDNSAANVRNPNSPPARIRFGNRSSDEMATLSIQVLPRSKEESLRLAEASTRRRLERRPDSWFLNNMLGGTLNKLGRYSEAAERFELAMAQDPGNPDPVYNLGNTFLARGEPEAAVAFYRQALALDPAHARVRNNLAIALQMTGDIDGAIEGLEGQLALSPEDARVQYNLGVARMSVGRVEEAIRPLETAARLDPGMSSAFDDLGEALRLTGDAKGARDAFSQSQVLEPEGLNAQFGLALITLAEGRDDAASQTIRVVVSNDDAYLSRLNNEAWRLATSGQVSDAGVALDLARLASELAPGEFAELLDTLAAAYAASGQFDRAVEAIERAIELVVSGAASEAYLDGFEQRRELYRSQRPYSAPRGGG